MFERHREKKAAQHLAAATAEWEHRRDAAAAALELATTYPGESSSELLLHRGEAVFFTVGGASLVEERATGGHYHGGSSGVSIPIGSIGGRSVRYRIGTSHGHWVQGTPTPTAVDNGTVYVTDQRVVFAGEHQTRECPFAKLLAVHRDDDAGTTTFSVSNRKSPVTVHYGPAVAGAFDFRLDLALAHYRGDVADLVGQLRAELSALDAARPIGPPA